MLVGLNHILIGMTVYVTACHCDMSGRTVPYSLGRPFKEEKKVRKGRKKEKEWSKKDMKCS